MTGQQVVLWLMLLYLVEVDGACPESDEMDAVCPDKCECRPQGAGQGITVDCQLKRLKNVPSLPMETTVVLLNYTDIHAIRREDFQNCNNLRTIDLSYNQIWSVENMSFQDTSNLSFLYLQGSLDVNVLPRGIFDHLYSIVELQLFEVIDNLRTYDRLENLLNNKSHLERLGINILPNIPLPPIFSRLVSLKYLEIHLFVDSGLGIDTFSALEKVTLQEVVIHCQRDCSIDIKALSCVTSLNTLTLIGLRTPGMTGDINMQSLIYTNIHKLVLYEASRYLDDVSSLFHALLGTNVTELHVVGGEMHSNLCVDVYRPDTACFVAGLEKVSIEMISIYGSYDGFVDTLSMFPDLEHLDIKQSEEIGPFRQFGERVNADDCRELFLAPKLVTLNMSYDASSWVDLSCVRLYLKQSVYMDHIDMSHSTFKTLNLQVLANPFSHKASEWINKIRHINLTSCHIEHMTLQLHDYPVYIQSMDLSSNNLAEFLASDYNATFSSNLESAHLRDLSLSNNVIKMLPVEIFQKSTSLQQIDLSDNALSSWQVSLAALGNITFLDLSNNLLSFLDDKTTKELTNIATDRVVSINLAENPLQCQCYTLSFLRWLHQARNTSVKGIHVINMNLYSCTLIDGKRSNFSNLTNIIQAMDVSCASSTWVIVSGTTLGLVLFVIILVAVIYRTRWNIRYVWLRITRQRKEDQDRNSERQHKYDAFVAYHQDDLHWIVHVLLPRLETGPEPLRLCVHHRNWLPGPTIEENISKSVEVSRKTLVILTKNFLRSGWCELELQLARMRGLEEGKDITLVVALEEIPLRQMSTTLANLRQNNTWLDWYEYENDRQQFWELLSEALSGPRVLRNRTGNQGEERDDDDIYLIT